MTQVSTAFESLLKRDRIVVLTALAVLVALAWAYLSFLAFAMPDRAPEGPALPGTSAPAMPMDPSAMNAMPGMDSSAMTSMQAHRSEAVYVLTAFGMWAAMMAGMMLPSAAPAILLVAALRRQNTAGAGAYGSSAEFTAGYLAAWSAFSLIAAAAQWGLSRAALLSPMLVATSTALGGGLFIAAGVYQLTPLKNLCLTRCRDPVRFIVERRRTGAFAWFRMGAHHGLYCIGCCWLLMALLFSFGVMNLLWVALIAAFIFVEKVLPPGRVVGRAAAVLMLGTGAVLLARGLP